MSTNLPRSLACPLAPPPPLRAQMELPPLHRAALFGHHEDLKRELEYQQDENRKLDLTRRKPPAEIRDAPDRYGRTALYFCTRSEYKTGDSALCESYLRSQGAEVLWASDCALCGGFSHPGARLADARWHKHKCHDVRMQRAGNVRSGRAQGTAQVATNPIHAEARSSEKFDKSL